MEKKGDGFFSGWKRYVMAIGETSTIKSFNFFHFYRGRRYFVSTKTTIKYYEFAGDGSNTETRDGFGKFLNGKGMHYGFFGVPGNVYFHGRVIAYIVFGYFIIWTDKTFFSL